MKTAIRKMGNSHGVIMPKPLLAEVGTKAIRSRPRVGWAEASKQLAATRDGDLVWPEFRNDADKHLKW
jgi:antitoxin MazE